ncbi:Unknown protein [Striga hermonthica]|uniref:Uncharacterized protein n=1 Tax=Striga hermonthica TaxID=68872 RepID=A0A9N7RAI2_STRHE|nr:Unknown protein [Striga hermonthica]
MSRKGHRGPIMEGLMGPTKIRKRGCSSSSSTSSRVYNYRLNKRAIMAGKNRAGLAVGLGRSRSTTPVPTWRTTPLRAAVESPRYSQSGRSTQPVSARRLAATLWEMNEDLTPKTSESGLSVLKGLQKKSGSKMVFKREKMQSGWGLHSGSCALPPHLSDPSHSPTASEKMDRSSTGSHRRRSPSISHTLMMADQNVRPIDSISNASLMEIETRSRPPTSTSPALTSRNRLKDATNALTTSKELLKIISRMWARAGPPSSSVPLISALHVELERARLQVNHLIQDQHRPGPNETDHLIKLLAEEKASWKKREKQAVEAAVGHVVAELDAERKLRRRLESLNKKLGKELLEVKSSFLKAVKELENEKRVREKTEEVCDELARNINEDRAEVERIKMESFKAHEEVEKEREMLELADKLREERVQMKLTEAKHQFEEKNSAVSKLRKQLEIFLHARKDEIVEDGLGESDLHWDELNADKHSKWPHVNKVINEVKGRSSCSGRPGSRRDGGLQRSASDGEFLDREPKMENPRSSYFDERQRYSRVRGVRDQVRLSSRLADESWPSRDPLDGTVEDADGVVQTKGSKSRTGVRRSKW